MFRTFAMVLVFAGCGEEEEEVSWSEDLRPVLEVSCARCHPSLDWNTSEGQQRETGCGGTQETWQSVVPGQPTVSAIWLMVNRNSCTIGGKMPQDRDLSFAEASPAEAELLKLWILQGALDN